ncbi:kinase-like domain-containing protein [Diaporthe sp. PMI_573]|nr:kinase-like domain-containing protein [Diaporthaceae sp. PMI_573]
MGDAAPTEEGAQPQGLSELASAIHEAEPICGDEIYAYFGRRVIRHKTPAGEPIAIKLMAPDRENPRGSNRTEADMMQHAAANGVLAPKVRALYDIYTDDPDRPAGCAVLSDLVAGEPLSDAWDGLSSADRAGVVVQLREQVARMRACAQPYIGRVGNKPTRNIYDRLPTTYCGPFPSEEAFDDWCMERVPVGFFGLAHWRWPRWLEKERRRSSGRFVLTHGDLSPRNIMVEDGKITGIVDWERSGFFPEYAEYAFAMKLCHKFQSSEKWWVPVLKEVLQPCSEQRLKFTRLVEDRGW